MGTLAKKIVDTSGPSHLVLTCMDYRHMDDLARELRASFGRDDAYDHLIQPGACLGVAQQTHREWGEAFWSQLAVARALHGVTIRHVWLVEHMDCGAYKAFVGGGAPLPDEEMVHRAMASLVEHAIRAWASRPEVAWSIDVARKIMRPHGDGSVWSLCDLDPLPADPPALPSKRGPARASR